MEAWAPGTLTIPSTAEWTKRAVLCRASGRDGLPERRRRQRRPDKRTGAVLRDEPAIYDTDRRRGKRRRREVAKGGNPLDPSDDMGLAVDKYGIWYLDNVVSSTPDTLNTTYYDINNPSSQPDVVDVTFDEWRGVGSRINTVELHIPAHGYVRFMPRTYTAINMGTMYVRSLSGASTGYAEIHQASNTAGQFDSAFSLQDASDASTKNIYVPFVNDGVASEYSRLPGIISPEEYG